MRRFGLGTSDAQSPLLLKKRGDIRGPPRQSIMEPKVSHIIWRAPQIGYTRQASLGNTVGITVWRGRRKCQIFERPAISVNV